MIICLWAYTPLRPPGEKPLFYPQLVKKFYERNEQRNFWFRETGDAKALRAELIDCVDSCSFYDLVAQPYHYKQIKEYADSAPVNATALEEMEKIYTDAALACLKDVYQGYKMFPWVEFDPISAGRSDTDDEFVLSSLSRAHSVKELHDLFDFLQPARSEYDSLKHELRVQKGTGDKNKIRQLTLSMNYFRWIHHFHFSKAIVVNICSAYLKYWENDSLIMSMKAVLGTPSTPTPTFDAWCPQLILYPYWYVPRKIALNEYVPRFRNNPALVDALNMQVIDDNGKIINHRKLNWSLFSRTYFPYNLRQSTGCDNALGVVKFDLASPLGVYLHDTNNKTSFLSGWRYYSHGCIRIEEPIELANHLLSNKLDTAFLQACFKDQKPIPVLLDAPVPVFVIYAPAEVGNSGNIQYCKDIYRLLK